MRVEAAGLDVRARPSVASEVVGHLKRGDTTVATLGDVDGWLIVRAGDGRTGYVAARHVELVRVIAVDGEPVPSRPAGRVDAGPCGPGAVELAIRDTRLECTDRVLGEGVESCEIALAVEATSGCEARLYRALECEIGIAWRGAAGAGERAERAAAGTVLVVDAGSAQDQVTVSWRAPEDETVRAVRLVTGSCALR